MRVGCNWERKPLIIFKVYEVKLEQKSDHEKSNCIDMFHLSHRMNLCSDGIFYATASESISYPEAGNEACFEMEDHSFWFRHRNVCIRELVRIFPPRGRGPIFK